MSFKDAAFPFGRRLRVKLIKYPRSFKGFGGKLVSFAVLKLVIFNKAVLNVVIAAVDTVAVGVIVICPVIVGNSVNYMHLLVKLTVGVVGEIITFEIGAGRGRNINRKKLIPVAGVIPLVNLGLADVFNRFGGNNAAFVILVIYGGAEGVFLIIILGAYFHVIAVFIGGVTLFVAVLVVNAEEHDKPVFVVFVKMATDFVIILVKKVDGNFSVHGIVDVIGGFKRFAGAVKKISGNRFCLFFGLLRRGFGFLGGHGVLARHAFRRRGKDGILILTAARAQSK